MQVTTPAQFELWEAVMWELAKQEGKQAMTRATISHYWAITHIDWIRLHRPPPEVSEAERFLTQLTRKHIKRVLADMTTEGWFTAGQPTIPEGINVQYIHTN